MQLASNAILTPETRQESLLRWMRRTGHNFEALGRGIGITGGALSSHCLNETMPVARHAQLVALGVPSELLPVPLDKKPGRPPKRDEFMVAFLGI